jgi:hypothetical protein
MNYNYNKRAINKILSLSKKRYVFIDAQQDSWNEEKMNYEYNPEEEIDELGEQIAELIYQFHLSLPFEFILEELTKLGDAPSLIYDDDGHFAIETEGYQQINTGDVPIDMEFQFWVTADKWKETPREALSYYINKNAEENVVEE